MPSVEQAAEALLEAIKGTEEYIGYDALRRLVAEDEGASALLRRFLSAQQAVQMSALAGREPREEDVAAFEGLSELLYQNDALSEYLLARMRVQQLVAGTMSRITAAVNLEVDIPEC